jgi:hypothetical protein
VGCVDRAPAGLGGSAHLAPDQPCGTAQRYARAPGGCDARARVYRPSREPAASQRLRAAAGQRLPAAMTR